MKRAQELKGLSSDHHRALVIAKKTRKSYAEALPSLNDIWLEIEQYFSSELENHLQAEEIYIVPTLLELGKHDLVNRLNKEHKEIRSYFVPNAARTSNALVSFGKLLEDHVRFEERELFNLVQEAFSPEALSAIEEACSK